MSYALIPDFSVPRPEPVAVLIERFAPDPVLAAIDRHRGAYAAFQVAPDGERAEYAEDAYHEASEALVGTACETRAGAVILLAHLRWWLGDEAEFRSAHDPAYSIAEARVADLSLFLGAKLPFVLAGRRSPIARLDAVAAGLISRLALRVGRVGEGVAALVLIAGGAWLAGFASVVS